jgi:glycerol-3-phosphate dehydrogenase subunit C
MVSEVLAYHAPCHLRAQGIGKPGLELLEMIPGLRLVDTDAGCCGIAGSYGFKADRYAIGLQVGQELFKAVRESGAGRVVSECGTCRLQITHATGATSLHPLSVLRESFVDTAGKS